MVLDPEQPTRGMTALPSVSELMTGIRYCGDSKNPLLKTSSRPPTLAEAQSKQLWVPSLIYNVASSSQRLYSEPALPSSAVHSSQDNKASRETTPDSTRPQSFPAFHSSPGISSVKPGKISPQRTTELAGRIALPSMPEPDFAPANAQQVPLYYGYPPTYVPGPPIPPTKNGHYIPSIRMDLRRNSVGLDSTLAQDVSDPIQRIPQMAPTGVTSDVYASPRHSMLSQLPPASSPAYPYPFRQLVWAPPGSNNLLVLPYPQHPNSILAIPYGMSPNQSQLYWGQVPVPVPFHSAMPSMMPLTASPYTLSPEPRVLTDVSSPGRVVKRRTRTGCLTCRKRRIKCDERKPTCNNCEKSQKVCLGYENRKPRLELESPKKVAQKTA